MVPSLVLCFLMKIEDNIFVNISKQFRVIKFDNFPRQNPPTAQFLPDAFMAPQPASGQSQTNVSAPLTNMGNRPPPTGPFGPTLPQHVSNNSPGSLPARSSTRWSSGPPAPQPGVASMPVATTFKYINGGYGIFCKPSDCTTKFYFYSTASSGTSFNISIIISASNISGSVPNFAPLKPPMMRAPSHCDFTFQPHRPQNPSFQTLPQTSSHFSTILLQPKTCPMQQE
ncbi:hypothetical protein ACFX2F_029031 [Malus domestica]